MDIRPCADGDTLLVAHYLERIYHFASFKRKMFAQMPSVLPLNLLIRVVGLEHDNNNTSIRPTKNYVCD